MSMLADDSSVMEKTKDLCSSIVEHPDFGLLQEKVEAFLSDDAARLQFQSVQERGEELHQKQHAGVELGESEVKAWETARAELLENDKIRVFLEARNQLETLQMTIGKYVGMTMETGRVPTAEDFKTEECCNEGGCGCSH